MPTCVPGARRNAWRTRAFVWLAAPPKPFTQVAMPAGAVHNLVSIGKAPECLELPRLGDGCLKGCDLPGFLTRACILPSAGSIVRGTPLP